MKKILLTSFFLIVAVATLTNCTNSSTFLPEKPIYEEDVIEDNGFIWKYLKYENHIDILVDKEVIISCNSDSIYSISDTCSVLFIAKVGEDSLFFYNSSGKNIIETTKQIVSYEIFPIKGVRYILVEDRDGYNGIYDLHGDTIIPITNKYKCNIKNDHDQWNTVYIIVEDDLERKAVYNLNGEKVISFLDCDNIELLTRTSDEDDNVEIPLGFIFEVNNSYGIFNLNGSIIVPPYYEEIECDYIAYDHNMPYWIVYTEDGEVGLYSNRGDYIVQCGYFDEINAMTDFERRENIWIRCIKEYDEYYKYAALDTLGKTIIPLQKESIFMEDGIWKYRDKNDVEKEYEFPNHVQTYYLGGVYNHDVTVEFYDNYIRVNGSKLESTGIHDGWVTYEETSWGGVETYYYLNSNYTMMHVMKMWDNWNGGYDYDYIKMTKITDNSIITDYSGINNFTNDYIISDVTSSGVSEDNGRWESYYQDNYRRREDLIQSHIQSLQLLESDDNPNGTTSYSINEIKRFIRESQREMLNIRIEAAQKGILI